MTFTYKRTIRFQDTDAAGVVYFANVLNICHEAYEESLAESGITLKSFFRSTLIAIPIVHATVDFLKPMFCGDQQIIYLTPKMSSQDTFTINYEIYSTEESTRLMSKAVTKHMCIDATIRARKELPESMMKWLDQWGATSELRC
ncbi:MAG: thioesterase family protein [Calothrix sp. MO_192.B10]|nr:thioesterase family protein [Calothrix sp. MO_192.B10]